MIASARSLRLRTALAAACAAFVLAGAANGAITTYTASMNGANEIPPNNSPGTGLARIDVDPVAHTMRVRANFSALLAGVTAAHIHAPTTVAFAGTVGVATQVPTFPGFPSGVTAGVYDMTFDMSQTSSYNPAFLAANGGTAAGAEAALFLAIADGKAYFNIHSTMFPGGEIRGFLACYPDCNQSLSLSVADFICYQTAFIAGNPYADCNADTALTIGDFICFQSSFVTGCP